VRLLDFRVDGFGKLTGLRVAFDPNFNVVYGPSVRLDTPTVSELAPLFVTVSVSVCGAFGWSTASS